VTQFVRSKHWIIPPVQVPNLKLFQWLFTHVPGFLKLSRFLFMMIMETEMKAFYMTKAAAAIRRSNTAEAVRYIKETAPQKYHDKLIPDFEMGCKRRIYDPSYLTSLHSENVTLRDDAIEEVTTKGIRSKDGHTDVDIIVFATGYETNSFCTNIDIIGRQGVTAEEHWKALGGPGAYNTTSISGFPNLFLVVGEAYFSFLFD
jgi:cation diffusion facilitator CzcD-associated flavoprotein CzcO